jgi:pilus assembly protein Flp/PilA
VGQPEIDAGAPGTFSKRAAFGLGDRENVDQECIMTKFFRDFLNDEAGASAAEYALILAIVGAGIGAAAYALGGAVKTAISNATSEVNACNGGGGC